MKKHYSFAPLFYHAPSNEIGEFASSDANVGHLRMPDSTCQQFVARGYGHRAGLALAVGLILALFLASCGGGDPQPFEPGAAPWQAGEIQRYQVTDINGQLAGSAEMAITPSLRSDNPDGWLLARTISALNESETNAVELTAKGYRPRLTEMVRRFGVSEQSTEAAYAGSQVLITLTTAQEITTYQQVSITSDTRDERSLLHIVRTLPLAEGYATRINSLLPVVGRQERVTVSVTGQVDVTVPAGTFPTWEVRMETPDKRITTAWIGRETPYPVIKFVDGRSRATYELTEFVSGS